MVSVSQELVALMQSSVVAIRAGFIRNAVALNNPCTLTLSSGAPDALGLLRLSMKKKFQMLRLEMKSLKLSQNVVAQKRSGKPRKSWDEVLVNDRKKLGMDSADPQDCSEWRGRL